MVAGRKKKYETGEASQYMTRKAALQYLQLSLKYFRKLCILKGIYPREPKNRRRAQKGKMAVKTLYARKDIQFLSHEPIIWKLRELKIFSKRMGRAYGLKDFAAMKRQLDLHPTLTLDHIIKERYPTFIDALRDLDDCLTLLFLFSTFPSLRHVPRDQAGLCRRLTVEFLHACIEAKALRKVFVSIKGYYFQVEIMGQTITWITPHHFSFVPLSTEEVDFRIMSSFVELYTVLLGFVNFQLFHNQNLVYPPTLAGYGEESEDKNLVDEDNFVAERVSALNIPLVSTGGQTVDDPDIDQFPVAADDDEDFEKKKEEILKVQKQKTLFKGLKVFLNREVPREPLVFALRSLGATVSWDKNLFVGATFDEVDETITHQIVDRPSVPQQFLSRYYVQPQWVFDCVNACELLPTDKYLMGAILPPHLSPFVVVDREKEYQPPELEEKLNPGTVRFFPKEMADEQPLEEEEKISEEEDDEVEENEKTANMSVTPGKIEKPDRVATKREARQDKNLVERMVSRKHQKLYQKMMESRRNKSKEIWLLRKKRRLIDTNKRVAKNPEELSQN